MPRDAKRLLEMRREATGEGPKPQGTSVGFGQYHYRYESGREGDAQPQRFAPRKQAPPSTCPDGIGSHEAALASLGPHTARGWLRLPPGSGRLDLNVLKHIVRRSYQTLTRDTYGLRARQGRQN